MCQLVSQLCGKSSRRRWAKVAYFKGCNVNTHTYTYTPHTHTCKCRRRQGSAAGFSRIERMNEPMSVRNRFSDEWFVGRHSIGCNAWETHLLARTYRHTPSIVRLTCLAVCWPFWRVACNYFDFNDFRFARFALCFRVTLIAKVNITTTATTATTSTTIAVTVVSINGAWGTACRCVAIKLTSVRISTTKYKTELSTNERNAYWEAIKWNVRNFQLL